MADATELEIYTTKKTNSITSEVVEPALLNRENLQADISFRLNKESNGTFSRRKRMKQISTVICAVILTATCVFSQTAESSKQENETVNQKADIEELINRYFDSLNETNEKRRRELTKQVWAEKGKFGTPYGEVAGQDAIEALIAGVQKRFTNSIVRRTTKIDGFGNYLRWGFTLSAADGTPILSGIDFAIIENGKLQLVMGFFDFAPNPTNAKAPEPKQ
jgi:hypothetical protein